jgi:uncharacterized phage protein (TIGR01671 family)
MRIIKFRLWQTQPEEMQYNWSVIPVDTTYLMQYTGLKDKNGKEIYEGDIILDKWKQKTEVKIEEFTMQTYDDGCVGIGFMLETHDRDDLKELEVIGNIYENPELINHEPK